MSFSSNLRHENTLRHDPYLKIKKYIFYYDTLIKEIKYILHPRVKWGNTSTSLKWCYDRSNAPHLPTTIEIYKSMKLVQAHVLSMA